jgi:hypothetical protein
MLMSSNAVLGQEKPNPAPQQSEQVEIQDTETEATNISKPTSVKKQVENSDHDDIGARPDPGVIRRIFRRVEFTGFVQVQFDDGNLRATSPEERRPANNGIGVSPVDSAVGLRRLRLTAHIPLGEDVGIKIGAPFENGLGAGVFDAYLWANIFDDYRVIAGRHKVRWGYEGLRGSWNMNVIERSDATRAIYSFRDTGVTLSHTSKEKGVTMDVGMFLGETQNGGARNGTYDLVYRAEYQPGKNFAFGYSGHYGVFNDGTPDNPVNIPLRQHDLTVRYYNGPWSIETEYLISDGFNYTSRADTRARGGYITAVRQIGPKFDAVVNFDWFDPDIDARNTVRADDRVNARNRWTMGTNYYFDRERYHRMMLAYEIHNETEGPSVNNNGFRCQYQYRF